MVMLLFLLSGGIDSPVAAHMIQTRGYNVDFIIYLTPLLTTETTINKIKKIANILNKYNSKNSKLFIVDFSLIQDEIINMNDSKYRITFFKKIIFGIC